MAYHSLVGTARDESPRVGVEQVSQVSGPATGRWLVSWQIQNLGGAPFQILTARCPHGKFRSRERELAPAPKLAPGESARIELPIACDGPPGSVVENAFLILRVLWLDKPWQVFARFRVVFAEDGGPETTTELVTTQRVGFSTEEAKL